jgi:ribosomal protein S12 methylthiotransferase accessory factor
VIRRVPITRVCDVTPLDPLGLPTFSAVTPLAADLTTHMGKGRDAASARVSALMEAIERVSAETTPDHAVRDATFDGLARVAPGDVVDPTSFVLPDDTAYRSDRRIAWVRADDLQTGRPMWMPRDLVVTPPTDGVLHDVDTNGLASGNTLLEAVIHGICEVIERDAWSQYEFQVEFGADQVAPPAPRRIDVATLPAELRRWIDTMADHGIDAVAHDITSDVRVTTIRVILTDRRFPTPSGTRAMRFQGLGCHPSAATAAMRAITEAVQSRMSVIQGARDDYNTIWPSRRPQSRAARDAVEAPGSDLAFDDLVSVSNDDLRADLDVLLDRLRAAGSEHVLVADLTRPDLAVPVVRVRVPGWSCFVVNRRRVDWRCLRHLL